MKSSVLFPLAFLLLLPILSEAQRRVCRPSTGKRGPVSESVFIEITDETNGKVVTYRKEFKLDHVHPSRREEYIQHLEDSLLYAGWNDFGLKGNRPRPVQNAAPRKPAARPAANSSQRVAGSK